MQQQMQPSCDNLNKHKTLQTNQYQPRHCSLRAKHVAMHNLNIYIERIFSWAARLWANMARTRRMCKPIHIWEVEMQTVQIPWPTVVLSLPSVFLAENKLFIFPTCVWYLQYLSFIQWWCLQTQWSVCYFYSHHSTTTAVLWRVL